MRALLMRASTLRSPLKRGSLAWLFWLALLLPLAQSAAGWHRYSHDALNAVAQDEGKQAAHAAHCDLCLVAAAVSGGALPSTGSSLPVQEASHVLALAAIVPLWLAAPALAYLSRAPPTPR